ncbi:MAG TPA: hypothetical protein VFG78_10420 [Gemmatimonadota bacterium]|nr:hypothetical protein [Gemmatimonadota bacterium]
MSRHVLLAAWVLLFPVMGCGGEPDDTEDLVPDTTEAEPTGWADSVSQWIHAGETAAVTNGEACLYVTSQAVNPGLLGDSIRVAIAPAPAEIDTLPPMEELPLAFQNAAGEGRKVFPPLYRFYAYDAEEQLFTEFSPTGEAVVVVAMCVIGRPGDEEALERALLARPDPTNPGALQYLEHEDPPAECKLTCMSPEGQEAARQAARPLERWLTGTPLTPTPAFAVQCTDCFKKGIGGGSGGNSPFAAVDTVVGGDSPEQQVD